MLPHPATAIAIVDLKYQELLRDAAKEQLADAAQRREPSMLARMRAVSPADAFRRRARQLLTAPARPARNAPFWQRPNLDSSA